MKTIILDVDDVILDLVPNWLRLYNKDFNDNLTTEQVTEWNITKFIKPEAKQSIYKYVHGGEVFRTAQPIKGAIKSILQIISWQNNRIVYVTAGDPMDAKYNWLCKHKILFRREDFVTAFDKSLIRGFSILDDKYENVVGFKGKQYLFDRPWNRHYNAPNRIYDWKEYMTQLRKDLE